MELGMIGLTTNMVRRLQRAGHHCVVYDTEAKATAKKEAA
jgi:6-phosphogluconate dehydrogenase (decarboxylating)